MTNNGYLNVQQADIHIKSPVEPMVQTPTLHQCDFWTLILTKVPIVEQQSSWDNAIQSSNSPKTLILSKVSIVEQRSSWNNARQRSNSPKTLILLKVSIIEQGVLGIILYKNQIPPKL
ncbi:hypothetical protein AVEN_163505-1 [Araneus ventricosus]|uniref:Uncharacterized protein n=1 Tax=Araneus ventricosus TaxID=182803 RepID=A0A4Y2BR89_ARAVE|nr:hypothetical protein AVEN_163505-1 [Araneus ventricosus]